MILKYIHHHSASARGYIRAGKPQIEKYHGRFGYGYIVHHPNNLGFYNSKTGKCHKSNDYHQIDYFVLGD